MGLALDAECLSVLGLGGLNNGIYFPQGSGGWKSKINVTTGLVSSETSLLVS